MGVSVLYVESGFPEEPEYDQSFFLAKNVLSCTFMAVLIVILVQPNHHKIPEPVPVVSLPLVQQTMFSLE